MKTATAEEFARDGRSVVHRPTNWRFMPFPVEPSVRRGVMRVERTTDYDAASVWDVAWDLLRET